MSERWPKFEVATFSAWDSVPDEGREALMSAGLPKEFFGGRYATLPEPALVAGLEGRRLVKFGTVMDMSGACLDLEDGKVLNLWEGAGKIPEILGVMNTSLGQFAATARALTEMFPFYEGDPDLDELEEVAARISRVIGDIDSIALVQDTFWATLVDDVLNGDFSIEAVLYTGGSRPS